MQEGLANQDSSNDDDIPPVQTVETTPEQKKKDSHSGTQERSEERSDDATHAIKRIMCLWCARIRKIPFWWLRPKRLKYGLAWYTLTDMKLHFLILFLVLLIILRYTDLMDPVPFTETVQGTLQYMSFAFTIVLTIFMNNSHVFFIQQGQSTKALAGSIVTFAMLLRVNLKNDVKLQHKLVCLANVGHYLTWAAIVSQVLEGDAMKKFMWKDLIHRGLLTKFEVENLEHFPIGNRDTLVSTWMLDKIGNWQYKKMDAGFLSMQDVLGIKNQIIDIRSKSETLKNAQARIENFGYISILCNILMLLLSINIYYVALCEPDPEIVNEVFWKMGLIIVTFISLFIVNMLILFQIPFGIGMSGKSRQDITFVGILEGTFDRSACILGAHLNPEENESTPTSTCTDQFLSRSELDDELGFRIKIHINYESELPKPLINWIT